MKKDIAEYVSRCLTCQMVKIEQKQPGGLLQTLEIPVWKGDEISMDFMVRLPRTKSRNNTLWVIVDRLTRSALFISMNCGWEMEQLTHAYIKYVLRFDGVPHKIVWSKNS